LDRGGHAVLSKRYRHRGVLDFRLTLPYAGFGPTCRKAAAAAILRTTTTNSACHTVVSRSRPRTKVHPASGRRAPICGMRMVLAPCRAVSDLPQGRRVDRVTRRGPPPQWRYAFR